VDRCALTEEERDLVKDGPPATSAPWLKSINSYLRAPAEGMLDADARHLPVGGDRSHSLARFLFSPISRR
jgi:hypothetical protein